MATWTTSRATAFSCMPRAAASTAAARHLFLLEPFDKPGQGRFNRCHRIGQSREVQCTIYYGRRTVGRLLAYPSPSKASRQRQ